MEFTRDWFVEYMEIWPEVFRRHGWDANAPKSILEIGCFEGLSTCWMLNNLLKHPDSRMVCLDTFQGGREHVSVAADIMTQVRETFFGNVEKTGRVDAVRVLEERSDTGLLRLLRENHDPFDFVYVDGSHLSTDVLVDLVLSFRLLNVGGLCICDDYLWEGQLDPRQTPKMAIDAFTSIFSEQIQFVPVINTQFAFNRTR
ncbi:MAG: class I SAM-dependent methyltransferase [Verrucomicrobia bacterium]|nr:class I SAM-dependent methyltransferase [Verrucomicrobiota bacterium]